MSALDTISCPQCARRIEEPPAPATRCPRCGWHGQAYLFHPPARQVDKPVDALPEDAACAHHPTKRAEHVCAGTGDYICSLCAVEIDGKTYSAAYLSHAEQEVTAGKLDRYLKRPDRAIIVFFILSIFPYTAIAGPVLWVLAWIRLFRTLKLRKTDPLFAQLVGSGRIAGLIVILGLWTAVYAIALIGILVAIIEVVATHAA
ncbi:MAG: hypothetical protein WC058_09485 [Phycisphaeraceae bacterium]